MNREDNPIYIDLQILKGKKDGHDSKTRDTRKEILELSYPNTKQDRQFFPK